MREVLARKFMAAGFILSRTYVTLLLPAKGLTVACYRSGEADCTTTIIDKRRSPRKAVHTLSNVTGGSF